MIYRNPQQRLVVLVDVQNLYYSAKNMYNAKVNYKKLLDIAVMDRILTRAIAYVIKSDTVEGEVSFFDAVNTAGFEIKEKDVQIFAGGAKKGDWDTGIAMDAIRLGHKVDSIVLISGDGDFCPVVNYLQQSLGCLVEVIAFGKTTNATLKEIADDFIDLDEKKDEVLMKRRPMRSNSRPSNKPRGTNYQSRKPVVEKSVQPAKPVLNKPKI